MTVNTSYCGCQIQLLLPASLALAARSKVYLSKSETFQDFFGGSGKSGKYTNFELSGPFSFSGVYRNKILTLALEFIEIRAVAKLQMPKDFLQI